MIKPINQTRNSFITLRHANFFVRPFPSKYKNYVTNKELLEKAEMNSLSKEVKRWRWKMIGHVLRQDRNSNTNIALSWTPEGRKKKGRPKTTWRRTVETKRNDAGWRSWEEAKAAAAYRETWSNSVEVLCARGHKEDK